MLSLRWSRASGLIQDPHPSHFPLDHLVENRGRIDAFELNRIGAFVEGAVTELRWGRKPYQLARHSPDLLVNGIRVPTVWTDWAVPWFLCPGCSRRCRHLYVPEFTCRICCRLDYSSRHVSRTVPGLHRITWLRRLIGVDQRPFAPIPGRPRSHTRYNRIAAEIQLLEHGLVGYLAGVNRDLQRRIRVRKSKGKW